MPDEIGAKSAYGTEEGCQEDNVYPLTKYGTSLIANNYNTIGNHSTLTADVVIGKITTGGKDYIYYIEYGVIKRFEMKLDVYEITPIDFDPIASELVGDIPLNNPTYTSQSMFVYGGTLYILEYNYSTDACLLSVVDPDTLVKSSSVTIATTDKLKNTYAKFACIIDGVLWGLFTDSKIRSFNITTGAETGELDISYMPTQPQTLSRINDKILMLADITSSSGDYSCRTYKFDGNRMSLPTRYPPLNDTNETISTSDYDKLLMFYQTSKSNYAMNMALKLGLLTTINVLPSPVTKLDTQTMKVTYTLTY